MGKYVYLYDKDIEMLEILKKEMLYGYDDDRFSRLFTNILSQKPKTLEDVGFHKCHDVKEPRMVGYERDTDGVSVAIWENEYMIVGNINNDELIAIANKAVEMFKE